LLSETGEFLRFDEIAEGEPLSFHTPR